MPNTNAKVDKFNQAYWIYTAQLDDQRLPKFVEAMVKHAPVSFQGERFIIQHIHMTPVKTIVVLKEIP